MKRIIKLSHAMDLTSGEISRRELLRAGAGLGFTLSGLGIGSGGAATETLKDNVAPVKANSDYKVYPPKEGCLVGFYKHDVPSRSIDHYENAFAAKPSILAIWTLLSDGFPMVEAKTIKGSGVVPYINVCPTYLYPGPAPYMGQKPMFDPADIVKGRCDGYIKQLAKNAVRLGEKHGGFFFATMVEFNAEWRTWSRTPYTAPAMRHFWQIFEDQGANQYATWVWEAFCPAKYEKRVVDPEPYYPGDKYVDWIGMNVFANLKNPRVHENTMFRDLLTPTYEQMVKNHPQKPVMIAEFGRTPGENQPSWLIDAFGSMKKEFERIKSAIYYDQITMLYGGQDHKLDQKSLSTLKDIFKDPYWIMAK